jgi:glycosyltransferase involved in cell wall biosynthesis
MPRVSIITPVFNAAKWLPSALASVKAQTLSDWEHIVVDDRSADESMSILASEAERDPRIQVMQMPENGGPSAARNLAMKAAQGRYLAFLDADDLWVPQKLERCVTWIESGEYELIYHDYRHLSHDGLRVGPVVAGPEVLDFETLHTRRGFGNCLTMVIDRTRVQNFRFPQNCPYLHEDFCALLSFVQEGHRGHRLPEELGFYRVSANSRSGNKWNAAAQTWKIYRNESKLPAFKAAYWWLQYAWRGVQLHRSSRPV